MDCSRLATDGVDNSPLSLTHSFTQVHSLDLDIDAMLGDAADRSRAAISNEPLPRARGAEVRRVSTFVRWHSTAALRQSA
ncbi:MAG: hypothetical protein AB7G11_14440 [Phycisphaerales bacterium]